MGESKRRKLLDPNFGTISRSIFIHNQQKELYKNIPTFHPDLGMHLYPTILSPLNIGSSQYHTMNDKYLGVMITGLLDSFKTEDLQLFSSISLDRTYCFTVALGEKSGADLLDLKSSLEAGTLSVVVDPPSKYLTDLKTEWVMPLKLIN